MPRSDDEALLRRLLSGWRASRDPALEEAIEGVGALVGQARGGPLRGKGEALEAAWLALANGAVAGDLDRLLKTPWPKDLKAAAARLRALAVLPADPRISSAVADIAIQYRDLAAGDLHRSIAGLLVRAPSVRLLPKLDIVEVARGEMTRAHYEHLRATIAAIEPTAGEPALLAAARARVGDRGDLDALWAQHVATPDDLALRAVLADRLQVAGDPRGEFIALQLAGTHARRAKRLLDEHIDAWTGPLPGIESRRFARGFLVAASIRLNPEWLARSLDRPEWVTIEELEVDGYAGDVAGLVARMPLLRRLTAPQWAIDQIAKARACPQLRVLVTDERVLFDRVAFPALEVFCVQAHFSARSIASHLKQVSELGPRAIGYSGLSLETLAALLKRRRKLDLRVLIDHESRGRETVWNLRVVGERAELAARGRGGEELDEILGVLRTAGIREIVQLDELDLLA